MERCSTCGALREPTAPCPGCLVGLGLQRPRRRTGMGVAALLVLLPTALFAGIGITLSGAPAHATDSAAPPPVRPPSTSPEEWAAMEKAREVDEAERRKLAAEEALLASERARAAAERAQAEVERQRAGLARERAGVQQQRAEAERAAAVRAAASAEQAALPVASTSPCADRTQLEPRAKKGRLDSADRDCLLEDGSVGALDLLVDNAFARKKYGQWATLGAERLQRAPEGNLAYRLALHHAGEKQYATAQRYADLARTHSGSWPGGTHGSRTAALDKVQALAKMRQP